MHPVSALKNLAPTQKEIIDILLRSRQPMSQTDVRAKMRSNPSQPAVSRIFSELVDQGILIKTGQTKGSRFSLSDLASYFAIPPQLRKPVPYDPSRIGEYAPNETRWIPPEVSSRFEAAAQGVVHQLDASTYSRQIAERFLLDLSWASSNLEGNTYDYLSTEVLLRYGQRAEGHDVVEATMILNHKKAIEELLENVDKPQYDSRFASRMHAMLMRDLISPEDLGRVRANAVRITATSYEPSSNRERLAGDLGLLLWKAEQVEDPFESAFLLLAGLSYLQAFVDGNKRMGRVLASIPLLAGGLPPMSFIGVDRGDYLSGLIAFYEIGDASLLAETIADAYEQSAPSYAAAVAVHRRPKGIELRERDRIQRLVSQLVGDRIPPSDAEESIRAALADLDREDQDAVLENVLGVLGGINPDNSIAWGVDSDAAEQYRAAVEAAGPGV